MRYAGPVKSLQLPADLAAPTALEFEDIRARVLSRADLADDVRGINASLELIERTRGGGWPTEPTTEEIDFVDLVWHELEFREGYSFSYAVYDTAGTYLGCCYLYPVGRRTELSAQLIEHDVDVSWWVTPEAYDRGYYVGLYRALRRWVTEDFPFTAPHYSNREIPELAEHAGTRPRRRPSRAARGPPGPPGHACGSCTGCRCGGEVGPRTRRPTDG